MSDESDESNEGTESGQTNQGQGQLRIERVYVKDLSFESPASPAVFSQNLEPQMNLEINTRSEPLGGDRHEVVLMATATATAGDQTAFIVEVQQAGIFQLIGLPQEVVHRVIGTVCPNTLFPYLREAVDSLVVRGGFPPLQLAPVNFDAIYAQMLEQQRAQASEKPH